MVIGVLILLEAFLFAFYGNISLSTITSYFHKENPSVSGMILFYGTNCSHCTNVQNFITSNNIQNKLKFTQLEVFNNPTNTNILADRSQICGLNPQEIGVPFFWDGKHCILGDKDIISFFKKEIAQK